MAGRTSEASIEDHPELAARLKELDRELEEGDITEKGYQKRRTVLLSQIFKPDQIAQVQAATRTLRIHSPDNSSHPVNDGSRAASLAALNAHSTVNARPNSGTESVPRSETLVNEAVGYAPSAAAGGQHAERDLAHRRQSTYSMQMEQEQAYGQYEGANDYQYSQQQGYGDQYGDQYRDDSRGNTLTEAQSYFSDFAGQQRYGGPQQRYSSVDALSPSAGMAPPPLRSSDLVPVSHQMPLEPRDITISLLDPHNPGVTMTKFDNIPSVLRHRARTNGKQTAYMVLDSRGKEIATCTWEKFGSRAEKTAQVIRDKSPLYRGDRVALVYRDSEIIDFAVALMGCFIAGVVAVPINNFENYAHLNHILASTQAHLALTTDYNLKTFQRDIQAHKWTWPRGVEWWKTNEFGSFHPKKQDDIPPLQVPDLAYIEFSEAPTGDLRGVVMSHKTVMHQMECLSAIIQTVPGVRKPSSAGHGETIVSYLDPRQGIGMIFAALLTVYGGHNLVWMEPRALTTPGLYAHLITRFRASIMLADYPGLKNVTFNYQDDPMTTRNFKKNQDPNFGALKLCLIDSLVVDGQFHEILADRWLNPMRAPRPREAVVPMLCLPEHGGMVISMKDWLGGEERLGVPLSLDEQSPMSDDEEPEVKETPNFSSLIGGGSVEIKTQRHANDLGEVLLDKEALKNNEVVVVGRGDEARRHTHDPGVVRVGAFGYPIPDATLAVVDPETSLLCMPYIVGEIWVDSPSLSGGFWALPKATESIFHARPYHFAEGNLNPTPIEPEFLRTGLLGVVIEGKVYVLGLYEDRIRQRVEWQEAGLDVIESRYYFVQHLIVSIMKNIPKIYDCSAFDCYVNDEHLPIVLLESMAASTLPALSGGPPRQLDTALLDSLSERCMDVLYQEHHLRVYCVMITAPNTLPRAWKNGRKEIGNILCRKEFENGSLPCVHVKFGVERAVMNLPIGVDPVGGIWSPVATQARQELLMMHDRQYSGVDYREVVIDDRTSTPLNQFSSIVDLLQWRVVRQAEELAYGTIDVRAKEGKGLTWKKFDLKISAVATQLRNKAKLREGDHVALMYTHSEEYVYAVHACFCLGLTVIPVGPLDQNRLGEDVPAFLHMVSDFHIKALLVNNDVDHLLKIKTVSQHMRQSAQIMKVNVPPMYNTNKPNKTTTSCRDAGYTMKQAWIAPAFPALIWTFWTPDQRRMAVQLGHDTILGMCKVQKETCQMTSSRPIVGCVRSTSGLGFIHTCLMGVFVGAPTYLVSPVDFAQNPLSLFLTLSRFKVKDTYATSQMLDHAMNVMPGKGFALHELKNLMISSEGRPRSDVFSRVRLHFANTGLDRTSINTIYSHVLNPMVASRSYMCIEPIELWLDTRALRRGLIAPVDPETDPTALLVQDSGMVPVSTQISIVNPETCRLCHIGEYGEIWVQSEANVKSFYGSKDAFDRERFNGRTVDGDPARRYVRTGDLGFLHNVSRPIGPGGQPVDMQILFVLGAIGETFEVNGLSHFPMDIESGVERAHRNIVPGGCAIFQAGGLVVVVVEVVRRAYLASMVPVIVNSILSGHQLVVDIVAFVMKGDFPRSRLGEKQRGKVLASWVTRKMRTVAQFGIRDMDGEGPAPAPRQENISRMPSRATMPRTTPPATLKNPFGAPATFPVQEYKASREEHIAPGSFVEEPEMLPPDVSPPEHQDFRLPDGVSELPVESMSVHSQDLHQGVGIMMDPAAELNGRRPSLDDITPTANPAVGSQGDPKRQSWLWNVQQASFSGPGPHIPAVIDEDDPLDDSLNFSYFPQHQPATVVPIAEDPHHEVHEADPHAIGSASFPLAPAPAAANTEQSSSFLAPVVPQLDTSTRRHSFNNQNPNLQRSPSSGSDVSSIRSPSVFGPGVYHQFQREQEALQHQHHQNLQRSPGEEGEDTLGALERPGALNAQSRQDSQDSVRSGRPKNDRYSLPSQRRSQFIIPPPPIPSEPPAGPPH